MNSSLRTIRTRFPRGLAIRTSSSSMKVSRCNNQCPSAARTTSSSCSRRTLSLSVNSTSMEHKRFLYSDVHNHALPGTLEDALRMTSHAVLVTETAMPFAVVNVNKAWENLCGYTYIESKGKSLGDLLKGPETDPLAVTALLSQLLRGEDATTVLTNYKKNGEKFQNRLHVGPLCGEDGKVTHFVGVLQEV